MKSNKQLNLLIKNSFRIFKKSKLLISQLSFLLITGLTIILSIVISNSLLNQSKSDIVNNGNLANFTITIPNEIREDSINQGQNVSIPTDSIVDNELKKKLSSLGLYYSITENVSLSNVQTNSNYIMYLTNNDADVNKLITKNHINFPIQKYDQQSWQQYTNAYAFVFTLSVCGFDGYLNEFYKDVYPLFDYDAYMNKYQPWKFMKLIQSGIWNIEESKIQPILDIVQHLSVAPKNIEEYNQYYNLYSSPTELNQNSYWYKWRKLMNFTNILYTGYGYEITCNQTVPILGETATIPFTIKLYDLSSYFTIVSSNYFNANNKKSIPIETLLDAMQLPLVNYNVSDSGLNPSTEINVYNPETNKKEPQSSFLSWMNSLSDDYKVYVNAIPYIIIDSGNTPDMTYPVLTYNNLLVDSKTSGVLYTNNAGYYRAIDGISSNENIYYSVRYPPDWSTIKKDNVFKELQNYTISNYGYNTVYNLTDPNQPNYLIYIRANFLDGLQMIILIVGIVVGLIIGFLSLVFICTLIRSIVKQNKNTFGIGIANGITKISLAIAFFPFALIPAIICGILSYIFSVLLVNPLNEVISQYWTLSIPNVHFTWWMFFVIVTIVFVGLYILIILVILWTLRKKTQDILNASSEFRMNWLIIHSKRLISKLGSMTSFGVTYMLGNISRFGILTLIVFLFTTLLSFTIGTFNQFSNALSYTNRNKNYTYAFDLYSPTINGGYYSPMPYSEIGISQMGNYNYYSSSGGQINGVDVNGWYVGNYDTPLTATPGTFYSGSEYADALEYPYISNKYFTSLYLPYTDLATQLNANINFFNNKVYIKAVLDVYLDIAGAPVNPWDIAKTIMPSSILNLATDLFEKQIQVNFEFYYWLQEQNKIAIAGGTSPYIENVSSQFNGAPIYYSTYLPNVNSQPFTLDGSEITNDYLIADNQNQWLFQRIYNYSTNNYEWKINQDNAILPAPTYTIKPKAIKTIVQILSNSENPLFQYWYKNIYNTPGSVDVVPEFSYKVGYGSVPVEINDETYTYLDANIIDKTSNISTKIIGINDNSKYINLYNNNDEIINSYLLNYQLNDKYPLIINEVASKLYGYNVGDVLNVNVTNIYDRFNRKNIGIDAFNNVQFEIVGITSSKSEIQFYTLQKYANKILGYQDFSDPNLVWNGPNNPGYGYVPFNGVFTDQELPKMFYNYGGIYSPSGINTSKGKWVNNIGINPGQVNGGELKNVVANNWELLPTLMRLTSLVNYNDNNLIYDASTVYPDIPMTNHNKEDVMIPIGDNLFNTELIGNWMRELIQLFGTDQPVIAEIQTLDTTQINIGQIFDGTMQTIELIILICFIPTFSIIILLMVIMILSESSRLISLMKVLGIKDSKNTFLFMFVYWVVLFLGIAISVPITFLGLLLTSQIIFNSFKIIVSPMAPVWIFFVAFGVIATAFALIYIYTYNKIKKINTAQAISVR